MAPGRRVGQHRIMPTKSETPPAAAPPSSPSNNFFDWMRGLGINREPGWIGGVCAGVATRLGIDPIIVRGIVIVVALLGGPALLLYAAAWLLLPDLNNRIHLERLIRGEFDSAVVGVGVLFLLALLPVSQGFWFAAPWGWDAPNWAASAGRIVWTVVVVGAITGLVIWASQRGRSGWPGSGAASNAAGSVGTGSTSTTAASASTTDADGDTVTAPASSAPAPGVAPTPPPSTPPTNPDEFTAWKERQAAWKQEHLAWRAQQAESARAIAIEHRRIRNEENTKRRLEWVEQNRRTRSNPLFSLIAIGVALIAGAATTLAVGAGAWTLPAVMTGLAVTLGVLGLAIVINGFIGRRSGGSTGMAVIVAIVLTFTSLASWFSGPIITSGPLDWTPSYSAAHTAQRTVISGDVTIDLSDYFDNAPPGGSNQEGEVTLNLVSGSVRVIAPADATTEIHSTAVGGGTTIVGGGLADNRATVSEITHTFRPTDTDAPTRRIQVTIVVVSGDVNLSQASN
jgi:phage shock protein PspC (stress-responsive transcriptional regulator)